MSQRSKVLLDQLGTVFDLSLYFWGDGWEVKSEKGPMGVGWGGKDVNGVQAGVRCAFGSMGLHDALKMLAERVHAILGEAVPQEEGHWRLEHTLCVSVHDPRGKESENNWSLRSEGSKPKPKAHVLFQKETEEGRNL